MAKRWELMRAVSIQAIKTVIERHQLDPVDGQYILTDEMFAEAVAFDERHGTGPSPEKLAELRAEFERRSSEVDDPDEVL